MDKFPRNINEFFDRHGEEYLLPYLDKADQEKMARGKIDAVNGSSQQELGGTGDLDVPLFSDIQVYQRSHARGKS